MRRPHRRVAVAEGGAANLPTDSLAQVGNETTWGVPGWLHQVRGFRGNSRVHSAITKRPQRSAVEPPGSFRGLVRPTTWPFSGLSPSVSEDQVRCNGGLGGAYRRRAATPSTKSSAKAGKELNAGPPGDETAPVVASTLTTLSES